MEQEKLDWCMRLKLSNVSRKEEMKIKKKYIYIYVADVELLTVLVNTYLCWLHFDNIKLLLNYRLCVLAQICRIISH